MPTALLIFAVLCCLFVANARRPTRNRLLMVLAFFPAWLVSELPRVVLVAQALVAAVMVAGGGLGQPQGWLGLGLLGLAWIGLFLVDRRAVRFRLEIEAFLDEHLGADHRTELAHVIHRDGDRTRRQRHLRPFNHRDRRVQTRRGVEFARHGNKRLYLDVSYPVEPVVGAPILLNVHGGAWISGFKEYQAQPLISRLASRGWVCVNSDYRLSPRAVFPDHLIDVKLALAWIRTHASEFGGDPDFIVISGGSAGGHLCTLAALTPNEPEYQPGFEDVDTSVAAAVPFYGIYDFTNRDRTMPDGWVDRFLGRMVMKKRFVDDPEAFRRASPRDQIRAEAPPFFVVHGDRDNVAPVEDARAFVKELSQISTQPVVYLEVPGAGHAFEIFHSERSSAAVDAVTRWLSSLHRSSLTD